MGENYGECGGEEALTVKMVELHLLAVLLCIHVVLENL